MVKKEIGSEFWDVPVSNSENNMFPTHARWFASGRSALNAIIQELSWAKTVAIPSWCCDSIIKPFADAGFTISFYPVAVNNDFIPNITNNCDVLLLVDYFGYYSQQNISHKCVIRDITHSLFSETRLEADYYFGSLRKWCGVWTGGFAWAKDGHHFNISEIVDRVYFSMREKAMILKKEYIENQNEDDLKKREFLELFAQAEDRLDNIGMADAAERDVFLANHLNKSYIREKRRNNASILMSELTDLLLFHTLKDEDCPLFVPVIIDEDKRDKLQQYLAKNKIYCPKHWPITEYHMLSDKTRDIYNKEISLICDQRYSETDMRRMIELIKSFK